ncbi:MAG: sigma-70 family RNA polymerase sigma factor [Planctomycetes bacterium]|nr:sigma-70 family RNA polymerase sigma factor [Planctomycetota bacterium]
MNLPGFDGVLRRARQRDPQALAALVQAYAARVSGLLFRLTRSRDAAEELTQETFLRVVRTIDAYEDSGRFESWLFRIAANLARDWGRSSRRRGNVAWIDATDDAADDVREFVQRVEARPDAQLADREARERLAEALGRLPEMDREILLLRHFSELPFQEIADVLGVPLGTALARAHRALERLRRECDFAADATEGGRHGR